MCPNGRFLAVLDSDGVKVLEIATGNAVSSATMPETAVMAFDPASRLLAGVTLSGGTGIHVVDVMTGKAVCAPLPYKVDIRGQMAFSPDGSQLAASWFDSSTSAGVVKVWEISTGREICSLRGHSQYINCLAYSPDGRRIASGGLDKTVIVWDLQTGKETLTFRGHTAVVNSLAFSPDGLRLASCSDDGTLRIWDARPLDAP
jgi:WD40 repeat protein